MLQGHYISSVYGTMTGVVKNKAVVKGVPCVMRIAYLGGRLLQMDSRSARSVESRPCCFAKEDQVNYPLCTAARRRTVAQGCRSYLRLRRVEPTGAVTVEVAVPSVLDTLHSQMNRCRQKHAALTVAEGGITGMRAALCTVSSGLYSTEKCDDAPLE